MIIFLDPGHGDNTPGKRSPDSKLREYRYAREIAAEVKKQLEQLGHTVMYTITGDNDMPLS
jgi:N-acetylmuramoyl-L-alanine amidase